MGEKIVLALFFISAMSAMSALGGWIADNYLQDKEQ